MITFVSKQSAYKKDIEAHVKSDPLCKEILKIEGIGPMTASAIVATIEDPKIFKNAREVSAWLGLVPKQHSSGNKIRLGGIGKRGDRYVLCLLVHGARLALKGVDNKTDKNSRWAANKKATQLMNDEEAQERRHYQGPSERISLNQRSST